MTDVAQSLTGEAREKEPATIRTPWQRIRPLACHDKAENPNAALIVGRKSHNTVVNARWRVTEMVDDPIGSPAIPSAENTDDKEEESLCVLHCQLAHLRGGTSLCSTADIHACSLRTR
jgi:hypothetical protein